jgi:hypothetical protein
MSLLIFGLGAAALLRAAHESFASNSSWRAAPEVPFAQRPDTMMPVLAALRVEPNSFDKVSDQTTAMPAPADQPARAAEPARTEAARNDQVAALRPAETPPVETVKPAEVPTPAPRAENSPAADAVPPPAVTSAIEPATGAEEHKVIVATSEAMPAKTKTTRDETTKSEPVRGDVVAARVEPVAAPASQPQENQAIASPEAAPAMEPADSIAATKIATLGGPPVDVAEETSIPLRAVKLPRARPDDQAAIRKRVQARRALHRRRLAALRARLLLQQQQANPFGQPQPFPQTAAAAPVAR